LRDVLRVFAPAAAQRRVQADNGLESLQLGQHQLVLCREQGLLRLQHRQEIGDSLAVLEFGNAKGVGRRRYLLLQRIDLVGEVCHLA
jgi:hypothetical protein